MFGSSENQYARRRLGDFIRELEAVYEEGIPSLMRDLRDDAPEQTSSTRSRLAQARTDIAHAMHSLEQATSELPAVTLEGEPWAATNGGVPSDGTSVAPQHSHDAASPSLHPSAAEIMEREG